MNILSHKRILVIYVPDKSWPCKLKSVPEITSVFVAAWSWMKKSFYWMHTFHTGPSVRHGRVFCFVVVNIPLSETKSWPGRSCTGVTTRRRLSGIETKTKIFVWRIGRDPREQLEKLQSLGPNPKSWKGERLVKDTLSWWVLVKLKQKYVNFCSISSVSWLNCEFFNITSPWFLGCFE